MLQRIITNLTNISLKSVLSYRSLLPAITPAPPTIHLGRWCHPDFNQKCNVDIKADLANLDNNFSSELNKLNRKD